MGRGLETSRREVSLATIREECKSTASLASSPQTNGRCWLGATKQFSHGIDLCAALLIIDRPLLQQARNYRAWLPSEIFPKYGNAAEKEEAIANRLRRATKRGKFSRAVWKFDVVLNSRQQEIPKQILSQIYEISLVFGQLFYLDKFYTTLTF